MSVVKSKWDKAVVLCLTLSQALSICYYRSYKEDNTHEIKLGTLISATL